MNPNEALKIIRREVSKILDENDASNPETLAETVRSLDEWLSHNGYPPEAWPVGRLDRLTRKN